MRKRLLLVISAFIVLGSLNAQGVKGSPRKGNFVKTSLANSVRRAPARTASVEAGEGQLWWANYDTDKNASWYIYGSGKAEHYDVAVYVPYGLVGGEGTTIAGFSFYPICAALMNDVQVWVSAELPAYGKAADLETVDVAASDITDMSFNDVTFSKEYVVPDDGLYVGYSFTISKAMTSYSQKPCPYTYTENMRENAFLMRTASAQDWDEGGDLVANILFGGGNFPKYAAEVNDFSTEYVLKGKTVSVPLTVTCRGTEDITSISYTVTTDYEKSLSAEKTVDFSLSGIGSKTTVAFSLDADDVIGRHVKAITITKVNGQPNENASNVANGTLITVAKSPASLPVVEEFTGTWCGYCPYGIVGMQKAHEQFGDQAALIAVHSGDVMQIEEYSYVIENFANGYPSATLNRESVFYPNSSALIYYINQALSRTTVGEIKLDAYWADEAQTAVKFNTTSTFAYDETEGDYGIVYILTVDGLKGGGTDWMQRNYLSGGSGDSEMQDWYDAGDYMTDMEFDHVAVSVFGNETYGAIFGIEGSISSSFTADAAMEYSYVGDISNQRADLDKTKLKAIALLVDNESLKIVNAAQTTIKDYVTGVEDVRNSLVSETSRYNALGQKVGTHQRGLNIMRMSDGSTRKVIVK